MLDYRIYYFEDRVLQYYEVGLPRDRTQSVTDYFWTFENATNGVGRFCPNPDKFEALECCSNELK